MSRRRVYLDHNASSPLRPEAREAMLVALDLTGNASSVHAEGRAARRVIEEAREEVAQLVGARPEQVIFTSGGTEANNMVLSEISTQWLEFNAQFCPGALLPHTELRGVGIVSAVEHASVMAGGRFDEEQLFIFPVDGDGRIDVDEAQGLIDRIFNEIQDPADIENRGDDPLFVASVMLANNETGVLEPVAELAQVVHDMNGVLHTDAVQAAGKLPLDMGALGVDALSLSAHKIGGPQGVGALVVRRDEMVLHDPLMRGGGQERRRRAGTENLAGIAGFAAAARQARAELGERPQDLRRMRDDMERRLRQVAPEVVIFSKEVARLPNTSCFAVPGMRAETLLIQLDLAGFAVSAGAACSSGKVESSHVLRAMGVSEELAQCAIRVSLGWTTGLEDVEAFLKAWEGLYRKFQMRRGQRSSAA